jgi:hypothetical protein
MANYQQCLENAEKRFNSNSLKLCPRGYCTAKNKFEVYPSAYANGYATQVCKGTQDDFLGNKELDKKYMEKLNTRIAKEDKPNSLQRWYKEEWVNVCEKGDGPGGYKKCGSGKGINDLKKYPYCRAYYKLPETTVTTAQELTPNEIDIMCKAKRSKKQGVDGKPTRVTLAENIVKGGGGLEIPIPIDIKKEAKLGLKLIELGFNGGTQTGWDRGAQLANDDTIDLDSLADMRTWFARHGPDAKNGGTSYPGYCKWVDDNKPMDGNKNEYRGAVSWLIWGGNPAYEWLKSNQVRNRIEKTFPKRKKSSKKNNLGC